MQFKWIGENRESLLIASLGASWRPGQIAALAEAREKAAGRVLATLPLRLGSPVRMQLTAAAGCELEIVQVNFAHRTQQTDAQNCFARCQRDT